MRGKKITRAEFMKNYINVDESEINTPVKEMESKDARMIFNPVTLFYHKFLGETEKAYLLQFEDASEHWFSKKLSRVNIKKKEIKLPKNFAQERNLLGFMIAGGL